MKTIHSEGFRLRPLRVLISNFYTIYLFYRVRGRLGRPWEGVKVLKVAETRSQARYDQTPTPMFIKPVQPFMNWLEERV